MNNTRLNITVIVIFILSFTGSYVIHGKLLVADYATLPIYRAVGEIKLPWIVLGHLCLAIGAAWIYAKGVEPKLWLGQGLRFGLALWLVVSVPSFFISYAVLRDETLFLMIKQSAYELVNKLVLGLVAAAIYRKA